MRISTRLRTVSTVTMSSLAVLVLVLVWSLIEFKSAKDDYALADTIKINFFERASFRDQYFLYREERARALWEQNKATADTLLQQAEMQFHSEEDRQILRQLRKGIEDTADIFHRIVNNTEVLKTATTNRRIYEELDKRLYSQLLLRANVVRDTATILKDTSAARVELTYQHLTLIIGLFAVALALATILNSMHLGRLIRKRLAPLHDGAKIVADGNLDYRIKTDGSDEFAELALSINTMSDKLVTEINAHKQVELLLRQSEEEIRTLVEHSPIAMIVDVGAGADEKVIMLNQQFTNLFGYTMENIPNVTHWWPLAYPEEKYREELILDWNDRVEKAIQSHGDIEPMETTVTCKDGSSRHVRVSLSSVGSKNIITFEDFTERKKNELALKESEARFRLMADSAPVFIWISDTNNAMIWFNQTALTFRGRRLEQEIGSGWTEGVHPDDLQPYLDEFVRHAEHREPFKIEFRLKRYDGKYRWIFDSGIPRFDQDGNFLGYIGSAFDINDHIKAETQLIESEARLRAILDNSPYLIWLKDADGRFIAVNKAFFNTTGLEKIQDVLGKTDLDLWPKQLAEKYRADDAEVISSRKQKLTEEMSIDNGIVRWVETLKAPIMDTNGNLLGTTGFAQDITGRKNADGQIRHLAHYDPLTDLPNRTLFSDRLQQALTSAKRDKAHMALIFLDLDKFKPINDTLGHHVGDLLLKEAAKRMQDCVRESDTVARIGGDEFVVLLPVIEATQDALLVAEKIRAALNLPFVLVGQSLNISSSTGVAVYPEHGKDETQLVKNADIAMYHAKEGGRNSVKLYQPNMQSDSL